MWLPLYTYVFLLCVYTQNVCVRTPTGNTLPASLLVGLEAWSWGDLASVGLAVLALTVKSTQDE